MNDSLVNTLALFLTPPAALLFVSLRRESRGASRTIFISLAFGFAGIYVILAAGSFFVASHPVADGLTLTLAAVACLVAGLFKLFRHPLDKRPTERNMGSTGALPGRRSYVLNINKWNVIGLCYIAVAIGLFICFQKLVIILPTNALQALWIVWGILLLVGIELVGSILLRLGTFRRSSTVNRWKYLLQPLVVLAGLAGMLVPFLLFPIRKHLDRIMTRNMVTLDKRRSLEMALIWLAWGTLSAVLSGIYYQQAAAIVLFGAIFIAPALIGAARFAGIISG